MKTRYTVQPDLKKTKAALPEGYNVPDLSKIGRFQSYDDMTKLLSEGKGGSFRAALPANASSGTTRGRRDDSNVNHAWGMSDDNDGDLAAQMRSQLGA